MYMHARTSGNFTSLKLISNPMAHHSAEEKCYATKFCVAIVHKSCNDDHNNYLSVAHSLVLPSHSFLTTCSTLPALKPSTPTLSVGEESFPRLCFLASSTSSRLVELRKCQFIILHACACACGARGPCTYIYMCDGCWN